jgi:hypothetical protein
MKYSIISMIGCLALAGCGLTAAQQATVTSAGVSLATVAAQQNTTVANLIGKGALFCQGATLASPGLVVLANSAGVPVSVTNQASSVVADACNALGMVPVSPPATAASVPVVATSSALPAAM